MLTRAEARVEASGTNVVNANTPGYRRRVDFATIVGNGTTSTQHVQEQHVHEFSPGKYQISEKPLDLAIEGEGFFVVGDGASLFYTRNGAFHREQGRLINAQRYVLQAAEGGDVQVGDGELGFASDATVLRDGAPAGRVAIVDFEDRAILKSQDGGLFSAPPEAAMAVDRPVLRQGMIESSNVNMGDEMVRMMEAMRGAETGQRLVQAYDDLMGRALNAFGGNG